MSRQRIRKRDRGPCVGDRRDRVDVQFRGLTPPPFSGVDFEERFRVDARRWATVNTVAGRTLFDGVNQRDVAITHEVILRRDERIDGETWLRFQGKRLKVEAVENLDERGRDLKLLCRERGDEDAAAARA